MPLIDDLLAKLPTKFNIGASSGGPGEPFNPGVDANLQAVATSDISHQIRTDSDIPYEYANTINQIRGILNEQHTTASSLGIISNSLQTSFPNMNSNNGLLILGLGALILLFAL